ncbi:NAD(P)-dependent oxidoreductase [Paenibacillus chitinolyticus]|uniref:SDR family oxidoreductase n=1 Tax=Paenibacillus chitinolyticus TaxID=79263 RepID=UPI0026E4EA26|nr:SDR family oxidoreductase [Paenibacillus chitinolyticus]GKS11484.1 NAD(P)-dependent oxidoreductase [Paenibacillus chitinolyticus]
MTTNNEQKQTFPPQHQNNQPGIETQMTPQPQFEDSNYRPAGKLKGKVALITGGDSGIGRAVAVAYAQEGADVAIVYLSEHSDAEKTKSLVEREGRKCLLIPGDLGDESFCKKVIDQTVSGFGKLDILVNNAGEQHPQNSLEDITAAQLEKTFRTNIFSMFFLTKAALPHLKRGSAVINTTSITAYKGNPTLIDYSSTKGAIVSFTRALSQSIIEKGIRVNGVAPGPIWTPLIPSTFTEDKVAAFGSDTPMQRAGQPEELAPSYVFLASDDSSYMSGQILHVNGGTVVNG